MKVRGVVKTLARHAALYVGRRPWLKHRVLRVVQKYPALEARLRRLAGFQSPGSAAVIGAACHGSELSPHARIIHQRIALAAQRQNERV